MKDILTQLFGDAVTDDAMKQFNAELGKKFVAKADFNAKVEEVKTLKGEKKFSHDAIKSHYFNLFRQDLAKEENKGKSAVDILHNLTKDDKNAFTGVTAVKLAGGRPAGTSGKTRDEIMAIKDGYTRRAEMLANAHLFPELNK